MFEQKKDVKGKFTYTIILCHLVTTNLFKCHFLNKHILPTNSFIDILQDIRKNHTKIKMNSSKDNFEL